MTPPPCRQQNVCQEAEEQRESADREAVPGSTRTQVRLLPRPPGIEGIRGQRPDHGLFVLCGRRGSLVIVHVGIAKSRIVGRDTEAQINGVFLQRLKRRRTRRYRLRVLQIHDKDRLDLDLQDRFALQLCCHFPVPLAVGEP